MAANGRLPKGTLPGILKTLGGLALGTARQTLRVNAAGSDVEFGPPPGLVRLDKGTVAAGASEIIIPIPQYADYEGFHVKLSSLIPQTNSVSFFLRMSNDAGATFPSGASDYRWGGILTSAAAANTGWGDAADNQINLGYSSIGNAATEGANISFDLMDAANANVHPSIQVKSTAKLSGELRNYSGSGVRANAQIVNALRIFPSSGNFASGKWLLLGYN